MKHGAGCNIPTTCHNQYAASQGEGTSQAIPRIFCSLLCHMHCSQQVIPPFYSCRDLPPQQCQLQLGPALNEELWLRLCAGLASPAHQQEPTQPHHHISSKAATEPLIGWQRAGGGFVMHLLQAALSQDGKRMFPEERQNVVFCSPHTASNSSSQLQRQHWQIFCAQSTLNTQPQLLINLPVTAPRRSPWAGLA